MRPVGRPRHCRTTPRRTCAPPRSGSPSDSSCGRSYAANVADFDVLTGIDVLVMKGDKIGALYTFIDPTVSSSVRFGSITLATRPPAAARVLRSRSCAGIDPDGTPGTIA